MIDMRELLKSGKRYRGFAPFGSAHVPVSLSVYVINSRDVKLRHVFPAKVFQSLKEGDIVYVLLEKNQNHILELRITRKDGKDLRARLDFITQDRRKLPRIFVDGFLVVEAMLRCGGKTYKGIVRDISMSALAIKVAGDMPPCEREFTISYGELSLPVKGKVIRRENDTVVFELEDTSLSFLELLHRLYSDILLSIQRA